MIKGIMVCEGEFEGYVQQPTQELMDVFASGFSLGADKYAGSALILTRDDLPYLQPKYDSERIALIEKHLPAGSKR